MTQKYHGENEMNTAFAAYMKEARKIPLLSAEQEISAARQAKKGGKAGESARNLLVTSNLLFVVARAKRQVRSGVPLEDLVQEGNFGLFRAVEKFDPDRGFRFLTYARWWIQQAFRRYLDDNGHAFRVPARSSQLISKMNRTINHKLQKGEEVSDESVALAMDVSVDVVRNLSEWALNPVSIHTPLFEGNVQLGDIIPDRDAVSPDEEIVTEQFLALIGKSLGKLDEKHLHIITLRFGLDGEEVHTLEEIGHIYGVSRERIRQLQAAALKLLSIGESGKELRSFL